MPRRKEPRISDAVLDQLLAGADPKSVFEPNGLIDDLKKALAERVLNAEMDSPGWRGAGPSAKRLWQEDGHHRHRLDRAGSAARPGGAV